MANYTATYHDATHTYRLSGCSIIMLGPDGLEHLLIRDTPDQARAHMKALIEVGSLRKDKPLSTRQRLEGQKKTTTSSIPQKRRKAQ